MTLAVRLCGAALALTMLEGCALLMKNENEQQIAEGNWETHRTQVEKIGHFTLQARVSSGGMFGIKGDLRWLQKPDGSFDLRVSGPFGIGAVGIAGTDEQVEVRTRKGTFETSDPEGWIQEKMGWTLPVRGLRRWVLGLPTARSEAHLELDIDGQVAVLEQEGWRLDYTEYADHNGVMLPRKFELANKEVKIKVLIDRWDLE
ncbi:MAG TPA: lipoprotein insertase outer membrane protein LolB [Solimonas sp.]|nr:lipoprotein insertase outer membrane protein LolB [Solimonas sp.]